jgi:exonuclease SbcD
MTEIIKAENIDLVLIAGDVFDHQAPTASTEDIVYETLLNFAQTGAQVVMIGGNHDHPERIDAVKPLLKLANVSASSLILAPENGGCIDVNVKSEETARIAMLPWPRRAKIVSADDLMNKEAAQHQGLYAERCGRVLRKLCESFSAETVNLVLAHLVITGSMVGGGERLSETAEDYWVPAEALNLNAQYVALGHIHRQQRLNLMWPSWYCGSPLQLDFGEEQDTKGVIVFDAKPGNLPVRDVKFVPLKAGRKMLTIHGTMQQLHQHAILGDLGDAYLRVFVNEPTRAGLSDEVREMLPNAVQVLIESANVLEPVVSTREGLQPRELINAYFDHVNVKDEGALTLFDELLEEEYASS